MDKDEALLLASKLKTNPRETNPWEILDNKTSNEYRRHGMMETNLLPIDIHKETPLEFEEEDDINEHESYFMSTPLNPCSREKTPNSIGPSNYTTQEIFKPLILLVHKDFERVVVDAYIYHKYCRSCCENLKIGVGGETTSLA
jgi:hypothetical protein